jgi:hypothetical protein
MVGFFLVLGFFGVVLGLGLGVGVGFGVGWWMEKNVRWSRE